MGHDRDVVAHVQPGGTSIHVVVTAHPRRRLARAEIS